MWNKNQDQTLMELKVKMQQNPSQRPLLHFLRNPIINS
jgi:hypothetical protein